jgi:hypothetical protein
VFAILMHSWEENGVRASVAMMQQMYGAALGSTVLGIVTILATVEKSHRWTLYRTRQTPREVLADYFHAVPHPVGARQTRDGQAICSIAWLHPSYLEKEAVKTFLLGLSAAHPLFADDEVLPTEAGGAANWTYDTWYKKTLTYVEFYGPAMKAEIERHFESMRAGIAARNERRRELKASMKALPPVKAEPVPLSDMSTKAVIKLWEAKEREFDGERAAWAAEREQLLMKLSG